MCEARNACWTHGTGVDMCANVPATLFRHRHSATRHTAALRVYTALVMTHHAFAGRLVSTHFLASCPLPTRHGMLQETPGWGQASVAASGSSTEPAGGRGSGEPSEQPDARELGFQPQATATVQTRDPATGTEEPAPVHDKLRRLGDASRSHHGTQVEVRADWKQPWRKQPGAPAGSHHIHLQVR